MNIYIRKYSIIDLRKQLPTSFENLKNSFSLYRKKFKILIIDDNDVPFSDTLKSLGYFVQRETDIKKLSEVEDFDLVLCDKRDVGRLMKVTGQGLYLAKKIKESYPFTPVILYSSEAFMYNDFDAIRILDDVISDAPDPDTFADYVDKQIKALLDPFKQWEKLNIELIKLGLTTRQISKVESNYVDQLIKTRSYTVSQGLPERLLSSAVKELLLKFAEQAIFHIFTS